MFRSLPTLLLLTTLIFAQATQFRRLRPRDGKEETADKDHHAPHWRRQAVDGPVSGFDHDRRLQVNGGGTFLISAQMRDGVQWCVDAAEGTQVGADGQFPSVGMRPCAFLAGPSEQLFGSYASGGTTSKGIVSQFNGEFCLQPGNATPKAGDRVRLGPCGTGNFFTQKLAPNGPPGTITVTSNPNLCVTFSGANPDDADYLVLANCADTSKFKWSRRTGWYRLRSSACVQVQGGTMTVGTPIVFDICDKGGSFQSHWRLDGDGLFHSRKDDKFCMRSSGTSAGSPIRLALCNKGDSNQRWNWPSGFEAPISLKSVPSLYLVTEGGSEEPGAAMVIGTNYLEWSGDAVHI